MKNAALVSLGELITLERRPVVIVPDNSYKEIGIYCFGRGIFHKTPRSGIEVGDKRLFLIKEGDFILQVTFAWEGAIALASSKENGMFGSTRFLTFRVDEARCFPKYLTNYFRTREGLAQLVKISPGSAGRNRVLSLKRIPEVFVPLPTISEQRRIVARIEELAAKIEEVRGLRQQAVNETEDLLTKISVELIDKLQCKTEPLNIVAEKMTGVAYKSQDFSHNEGIPVVRLKEIGTKSPTIYLRDHEKYQNIWIAEGDIILAKTSFSTGAMCMWSGPKSVLNQNAILLRAKGKLEQQFLYFWLKQQVHRYLQNQLTDPNFYPYIRERDLVTWLVPIPTPKEQRQIVNYLVNLQSKIDILRRLQAETAVELDALLPSILDKAFKGEL